MRTCFPAVAVLAIATLQVLIEIASPRGGTIAQELPPSYAESGAPATALNRRLDIEFKETRLVDAIDYLQQQTGVTFYLRAKKLEEQGVNVDTPITSQFRAIRLESWLDLALDDLDLTWMVKDDLIVITTREDEERQLVTRVYDCRDLLAIPQISDPAADPVTPGSDKEAAAADKAAPNTSSPAVIGCGSVRRTPQRPADPAEHLMEVITQAVDLATWDENGGPGTIGEYRGMLVVTQTDRIHAKIANVLNMMRQSAGLEASKTGQVVR
jgi:hypothetical protein